jgi:phytoene dehydrogenase-like protein
VAARALHRARPRARPPLASTSRRQLDAVVVGAGPNGLAAAVTLADAGRSVLVLEAKETIGGGTRTAELTLPGFRHDVCSAVHPLVATSPFFESLGLELDLVEPPAAVAHPLDDGSAVLTRRSVEETALSLGSDADAYRQLFAPLVDAWTDLRKDLLGPIVHRPRRPLGLARFGLTALGSARRVAESHFETEGARALFAGAAAHSFLPLDQTASSSFGLVLLTLAHVSGWPFPRGGSQAIPDALATRLRRLGGEIETGTEVSALAELPPSRQVLCDVTPRQLVAIADRALPARYRRRLGRWRYGPGVFKADFALDGPIPWRTPDVAEAGTVHLGGSLAEIAASESDVWQGRHPERPFVLLAQQTLFDDTRAPAGRHTAWTYCHVPHGSTRDMRDRIETQIERFAPGFRDRILACSTRTTADLERENPNLIGGDISGGANTLGQLVSRPVSRLNPYATPLPWLYLCSASTPPGGGVHGMCGHLAAKAALARG